METQSGVGMDWISAAPGSDGRQNSGVICRPSLVAVPLRWSGILEKTMPDAPSPLLSSPETARYLGIKPQTLRKWRLTGHGPPYIRLGDSPRSRVAYRLADLEAWGAARTFRSTAAETVAKDGR